MLLGRHPSFVKSLYLFTISMLYTKKSRVIRKIVQTQLELSKSTASSVVSGLNKKLSIVYQICRISFVIIIFSSCVFQCVQQLIYYRQKPIKVQADFTENSVGDFPAIYVYTTITDESTKYDKISREAGINECIQGITFFEDNHSDLHRLMKMRNFTTMIQNTRLLRGSHVYNDTFKTTEIYSLISLGTKIENVKKISLGPESRARIQIQTNMTFQDYLGLRVVLTSKKQKHFALILPPYHLGHIFLANVVAHTFKKYKFINRRLAPCVDETEVEQCQTKCYMDEVDAKNFTCQFPFLPQEQKNNCIANNLSCSYLGVLNDITTKLNAHFDCHCPTACEKTMVTSHYFFRDKTDKSIEVYSFSNWIRSFTEYFFYDFIALMCDIGGSLSFYLGVSCLSMIDISTRSIWILKKKLELYLRKKNRFETKVTYKAQKIILREMQIYTQFSFNVNFKRIFFLVMSCLSIFLVYEQIMKYRTYATFETIELVQEEYIQIPPFVMCAESEAIYAEKEKIKEEKQLNNICAEDIDILDLLDEPSKYNASADLLWEETGGEENYEMAELIMRQILNKMKNTIYVYATRTYLSTVFGNCIHFQSERIKYTEKDTAVIVAYQSQGLQCNSQSKIFVMHTDKTINYNLLALQPHNSLLTVRFYKQTIQRLYTPVNPCMSKRQFEKCETDCLRNRLWKENIKCRLPFFNSSSLLACNTSVSAKETRKSYLSVYSNIDGNYVCKCYPMCEQIVYTAFSEYVQSYQFNDIIATLLQFTSNVNEIFKQVFVMPLAKCICDVGSILGFFLGISVLSFLELLQTVCHITNSKMF